MRRTHTVPTHAGEVRDRFSLGLTAPQWLSLAGAAAAGAWVYLHVPLPLVPRLALVAALALAGLALALIRPTGLSLPAYLALRLAHALTPRRVVWQRSGLVIPPSPHPRPRVGGTRGRRAPRRGGRR